MSINVITKGFYGDVISPIEEALHDRIRCFGKTLDKLFNVSDKPQRPFHF